MKIHSLILTAVIAFAIVACTRSYEVQMTFRESPNTFSGDEIYVDRVPVGKVERVFETDNVWYVVGIFPNTVKISRNARLQTGFSPYGRNVFITNGDSLYVNDGDSLRGGEVTIHFLDKDPLPDTVSFDEFFAKDSLIKKKALDMIMEYNKRRKSNNQ